MDLTDLHETERADEIYENLKNKVGRSASVPDLQAYILKEIRKQDKNQERRSKVLARHSTDLSSIQSSRSSTGFTSISDSIGMGEGLLDSNKEAVQKMKVRYTFRKQVSYWSIISFIIGSLLFGLGCMAGILGVIDVEGVDHAEKSEAFITWPFFMGSVCFRFGSYCGWFRIINKNYKGEGVIFYGFVNSWSYIKSTLYGAGGVLYLAQQINKMIQHGIKDHFKYEMEVVLILTLASALQQVAAFIDLYQNWEQATSCNPSSKYFWAVNLNFWGCTMFSIGSACGFFTTDSRWINWSYFIGSIFFGVGTWVWLYIWKQEQWRFYHPLDTDTYVSVYQQLYITLVIISLSCSLCVLVFYAARAEPFDHFYCMIAFYGILLHLGLLQLTNALAQIPQDKGWGNMIRYLHFSTLIFFIINCLAMINIYDECLWKTGQGCS